MNAFLISINVFYFLFISKTRFLEYLLQRIIVFKFLFKIVSYNLHFYFLLFLLQVKLYPITSKILKLMQFQSIKGKQFIFQTLQIAKLVGTHTLVDVHLFIVLYSDFWLNVTFILKNLKLPLFLSYLVKKWNWDNFYKLSHLKIILFFSIHHTSFL